MSENVTILGTGAMGTVCSKLFLHNGHRVTMWGASAETVDLLARTRDNSRLVPGMKVPDAVTLTADERACFAGSTLIVSAVPTQFLRACWSRLVPYVGNQAIVSVSKGVEADTLMRPSQVIADVLHQRGLHNQVGVLSGPNIAAELVRHAPASAVVACHEEAEARRIQQAMNTSWFRVYRNFDVIGVELAGATKNIIALAAGMIDGIEGGNNAKAALVTRGLIEISRLGVALGANPLTFQGLAGLGDLLTTCVSPEGRNRSVGEQLGRGRKLVDILSNMKSVAEGIPTTASVRELARRHDVEMPITEQVYQILFEQKDPRKALADLMSRGLKSE
jgi:glycerol-3-phosphate dehydrogenase (NAD(P)+)